MADIELIVKMPEELAEKGHWYTDEEMWTVIKAAQNGTPIPDNATNIQVLRAIFKPNNVKRTDDNVIIEEYQFDTDWLNAPYQKGGKE